MSRRPALHFVFVAHLFTQLARQGSSGVEGTEGTEGTDMTTYSVVVPLSFPALCNVLAAFPPLKLDPFNSFAIDLGDHLRCFKGH